jgi:ketosteroid isomerase-like protein
VIDSFRDLMDARHADFVQRFNAADADGIADTFYGPDATILPPNHPPIAGRDAIRAFLRDFHSSAERRCTITVTHVEAIDDLAYVIGTYTASARFSDGSMFDDEGNLLEAWRRDEGGTWWCVADMYASSRPEASDSAPTAVPPMTRAG